MYVCVFNVVAAGLKRDAPPMFWVRALVSMDA